jgi:hypothetical protein
MRGNILKTKIVAVNKLTFSTKNQRENPTRTTLIPTVANNTKDLHLMQIWCIFTSVKIKYYDKTKYILYKTKR